MSRTFRWGAIGLILMALGVTGWMLWAPPVPHHDQGRAFNRWPVPFPDAIHALGEVTPAPELIHLRPAQSGLVMAVLAQVGAHVHAGQPLLKLDDRDLQAQKTALEAELKAARLELAGEQELFDYYDRLYRKHDGQFISAERYTLAKNNLRAARAKVMRIQGQLAALKLRWQQRTLTAPVAGILVHFAVAPGMWLNSHEQPADEMILAPDGPHWLRVEVSQYDFTRFDPKAQAVAWPWGQPQQKVRLIFDHLEPQARAHTLSDTLVSVRDVLPVVWVYYRLPPEVKALPGSRFNVFIQPRS